MRHNNIYIQDTGRSDGQTQKDRPENAGIETDWHTQPSSRLCCRRSIQRQSIFRCQGSSAGPLRDAAPPQRGRSLDRGCGYQFRCFAAHCLSGSGSIPAKWPEWSASQAPRPQRRAQAVLRGPRLRAIPACCRARLDDRRLCPSRTGKVRHPGPPPQSGAGVSEQKKTAQSGLRSPIPEGTVEAYEQLRRQVVRPDGRGGGMESRRVFMRCGLAPWAQMAPSVEPARPPEPHFPYGLEVPVLDSLGAELVRLIASLILSTRQEGCLHALTESYPPASGTRCLSL